MVWVVLHPRSSLTLASSSGPVPYGMDNAAPYANQVFMAVSALNVE